MAYPGEMSSVGCEEPGRRSHTDREISEFLLRACHDLRASVRAVRTHSELFVREAGASPALADRLNFVVDGAKKIDSLVNGIAAYSVALQTDPATFQTTRLDVLLRSVLMKLNGEIRESGAKVVYEDLPEVTGHPDRLMQVLENMLRNSLAYRGEGTPEIEIAAHREGDAWVIAVRDHGPGVEAESLEKIFKPFERLPGGHRNGSGLGLAICRAIVERHGGRIWAESEPGKGATLRFTLPA
jgi:chemotaxis family two-component system sensor kinase Cph1